MSKKKPETDPVHWEALFDKKYLRWFHLQEKEWEMEIEKVERQEMTLPNGEESVRPVVIFKGIAKPLVINTTNASLIARELGSNRPSDWVGKKITLYPTTTRFGRDMKECIRVKRTRK